MQAKQIIEESLIKILGSMRVDLGNQKVQLEHPQEESFGDYSTNIAMVALKGSGYTSPMELAEELVKRLREDIAIKNTAEITAVKPGFINFSLERDVFGKELELALNQEECYGQRDGCKETETKNVPVMVIDYSAPNIAKRFGIGHLRSTIIGQALYNSYNFLGWKTIGDNHIGDWGTQFGVLLYQITAKNLDVYKLNINDVEKLYVEFNNDLKENPDLKEEARKWFKKLEDGDKTAREIWEKLKEISLEEFDRIYELLGVKIDYTYGESFYESMLQGVVDDFVAKGLAQEDQGALVVKFDKDSMPPAILKKSDGASTYLTRDLATIKYRASEWNPDLILYEVGAEQALHFEQVFTTAAMVGYISKDKLVHIPHGLYLGKDGKKMRTRSGDTVKLEEVLDEAIKRATKLANSKQQIAHRPGTQEDPVRYELSAISSSNEIAKVVGIGAVKYFDLSHQPATNIVFDWEKVFQMDGNSAPYLQYTYARAKSVLRKTAPMESWEFAEGLELNEEEMRILRHFYKFGEVVEQAAINYSPNLLCSFLFELAQRYNAFYNKHRVLDAEGDEKVFRLALTQVTGNILKTGLNLLGISAPKRM